MDFDSADSVARGRQAIRAELLTQFMGHAASCSGGGLSKSGVAEKMIYHFPEML